MGYISLTVTQKILNDLRKPSESSLQWAKIPFFVLKAWQKETPEAQKDCKPRHAISWLESDQYTSSIQLRILQNNFTA